MYFYVLSNLGISLFFDNVLIQQTKLKWHFIKWILIFEVFFLLKKHLEAICFELTPYKFNWIEMNWIIEHSWMWFMVVKLGNSIGKE